MMALSCAILAYVPPKGILHSESFVENIQAFDPGLPMILFSNDPNWGFNLCADPEILKNPHSRFRIANMIFLMALRLALDNGFSHLALVESDSRIRGDGWAWLMWQEFLSYPGIYISGTPALFNISRMQNVTPRKMVEFAADVYLATSTVVSTYGLQPSVTAFINGSLAVYDAQICHSIFRTLGMDDDLVAAARTASPFDCILGRALTNKFGIRMLDCLGPSALVYSSVDKCYSENQRIEMLRSGRFLGVHPIKGNSTCLD